MKINKQSDELVMEREPLHAVKTGRCLKRDAQSRAKIKRGKDSKWMQGNLNYCWQIIIHKYPGLRCLVLCLLRSCVFLKFLRFRSCVVFVSVWFACFEVASLMLRFASLIRKRLHKATTEIGEFPFKSSGNSKLCRFKISATSKLRRFYFSLRR